MADNDELRKMAAHLSTRRTFLRSSALLGAGVTVGGLLSACGDSGESGGATGATTGGAGATPGGGGASTPSSAAPTGGSATSSAGPAGSTSSASSTATGGTSQGASTEITKLGWISPRGTLEVMDDYNLWASIDQGYFEGLGVSVDMIAGPNDATATTKFVGQKQADVGYPSPGVLTASIETGVEVISIWEMMAGQTFDFAVPKGSPIKKPQDLAGKTIAVATGGWQVIVDPMLVELGIDPKSVKYVVAGQQWGQFAADGKTDAALTWEGLRAQWPAEGIELDYFLGQDWSKFPSNVYCVRKADLDDPKMLDVYQRFLKGMVMGFEFSKANPRAAAQIVYEKFPALKTQMKPQVALESMMQTGHLYGTSARNGDGWGFHYKEGWQSYLDIIHKLGQIAKPLKVDDVLTNQLVGPANKDADVDRARADAKKFELNSEFAATKPPADLAL